MARQPEGTISAGTPISDFPGSKTGGQISVVYKLTRVAKTAPSIEMRPITFLVTLRFQGTDWLGELHVQIGSKKEEQPQPSPSRATLARPRRGCKQGLCLGPWGRSHGSWGVGTLHCRQGHGSRGCPTAPSGINTSFQALAEPQPGLASPAQCCLSPGGHTASLRGPR